MLAFPLLELGRMADAENAAKRGYVINRQDFWAQHAVSSNFCDILGRLDIKFLPLICVLGYCFQVYNLYAP